MVSVRAEMIDGTVHEVTASDKLVMCTAAKWDFQKQFPDVNFIGVADALSRLIEEDEDGTRLSGDADLELAREEYFAFFQWWILSKQADDVPDFDEFMGSAVEIVMDTSDPTSPPRQET